MRRSPIFGGSLKAIHLLTALVDCWYIWLGRNGGAALMVVKYSCVGIRVTMYHDVAVYCRTQPRNRRNPLSSPTVRDSCPVVALNRHFCGTKLVIFCLR